MVEIIHYHKKKLWGIFFLILFILWQGINFYRGMVTAEAMNYYCESEGGVKFDPYATKLILNDNEYNFYCFKNKNLNPNYFCPMYKESREVEHIPVKNSVTTDKHFFGKKYAASEYGWKDNKFRVGGLIKTTRVITMANEGLENKIVKTTIDFEPNSTLFGIDEFAYNLYKKQYYGNYTSSCSFPKISSHYEPSKQNFYVNK